MRLTIRRRLVLTIGTACLAVLACVGWASVRAVSQELTRRLDVELVRSTESGVQASAILSPEQSQSFQELSPSEHTIGVIEDGRFTVVIPAGGRQSPAPGPDLDEARVARLLAEPGTVITAPAVGGGADQRVVALPLSERTTLVFAQSLEAVNDTVHDLAVSIVVVCGVGLAVLLGLVMLAGRAVVRPLERIVASTSLIGAGEVQTIDEDQPDLDTKRLAEGINAMLDRLREAFDAVNESEAQLREFLSETSHELRTPLAVVRANSEMLMADGVDAEARARAVAAIEAASVRMSRLVDDLFLLARLDQGHALDVEELDLGPLVDDAVQDLVVLQPERPVELVGARERVVVAGDRQRLRQAFDNVLGNVRAHTPDEVPLHVSLSVIGSEVHVRFRDEGPGVGTDELAHVFERFYRADRSHRRAPSGSGLGLAIVASVVAAHGGRVSLGGPGPGFVLEVVLPVVRVDAPEPADASAGPSPM